MWGETQFSTRLALAYAGRVVWEVGTLRRRGFPDCFSSKVTATGAFAERRTLCRGGEDP